MASKANNVCHVVAMPMPAVGHINPMMNLCKLLALKNQDILFTFVTLQKYIRPDENFPNIRFVNIPNNILPEESQTAGLGLAYAVMTKLGAPFEQILDSLQPPATFIITDLSLSWAVHAANHRNIPVAGFWPANTTEFCLLCHLNLFKEKQFPTDLEEHGDEVVDFIPGIPPLRVADLPRVVLDDGNIVALDALGAWGFNLPISEIQYLLCPSVYELETQVFDFLRAKYNFPIYSLGPLIPYFDCNDDKVSPTPDYVEWLNSQPANSVLYVSMGSSHSPTSAQTDEMVAGLRSSGVRYLWVGRENTSQLQKECGELGMVIPWCNQMRVLNHSSVSGFLTHCGLSSTLEASFLGVPMLTFPLHGEQFINSKLVVECWKVGWRLRTEVGKNKLITREAIAKTVQEFMNGYDRRELVENAKQLQKIIKGAVAKGGSSDANLDAFFKDVTQGHVH